MSDYLESSDEVMLVEVGTDEYELVAINAPATGPVGPAGDPGLDGLMLTYMGEWTTDETYAERDIVINKDSGDDTGDGSGYICIQAHTSTAANRPNGVDGAAYWGLIVQRGEVGTQGPAGDNTATPGADAATWRWKGNWSDNNKLYQSGDVVHRAVYTDSNGNEKGGGAFICKFAADGSVLSHNSSTNNGPGDDADKWARVVQRGARGPAGARAELSIGTITTGSPGGSASATVTGSGPHYKLNMTIPRGATGNDGQSVTGPRGPRGYTGDAGADAAQMVSFFSPGDGFLVLPWATESMTFNDYTMSDDSTGIVTLELNGDEVELPSLSDPLTLEYGHSLKIIFEMVDEYCAISLGRVDTP